MSVNIGADHANDQFYRYKMPALQSKVEGRGNGVKTNIVNLVDVAKALGRPPGYAIKFFACELGAQSKFDEKTGTAIVNGAHDTGKLSGLLETFIKKFVQCGQCKNPETDVVVTKKKDVQLECQACGSKTPVDMRHKLTTYIMNNPPERKHRVSQPQGDQVEGSLDAEAEQAKKEKREKEKKKKKKKKDSETAEERERRKEKKRKKKEERRRPENEAPSSDADSDEVDSTQFRTDTSKEAQEERMKQLSAAAKALTTSDGDTHKQTQAHDNDDEADVEGEEEDEEVVTVRAAAKELGPEGTIKKLTELGIKRSEYEAYTLVEALLGGSSSVAKRARAVSEHFRLFSANDAAKQELLLCALESFFASEPSTLRELPIVLKVLYEGDALDEEAVYKWHADPSIASEFGVEAKEASAVRKAATKFVHLLQKAEQEEQGQDDGKPQGGTTNDEDSKSESDS